MLKTPFDPKGFYNCSWFRMERSFDGFLLIRSHFDVSKLLESFPETPRPLHVLQYDEMKFYSDSLATIYYCTKLFYCDC